MQEEEKVEKYFQRKLNLRDCYLKKNRDFQRVYSKKRTDGNKTFTLFYKKNGLDHKRVGFVITKKVAKAVYRNKIKRRLREIYKANFDVLKEGYDYVFVVKHQATELEYKDLEKSFLHLAKRFEKNGKNSKIAD
ncbi:ribonuclease P protein component [Peptoniphilus asaccharolyticus DSM 20463]|uniref:Ribonuclease P protein component n=1 Tax=Peptoniphilus asaccharolyticus DSM 20463 TaxID=573058 RepID=A0A1W1V3Y2_PEPAS|nr:ribonuclease P protein component [Peptoniphilus asaccharolyticus]MBL7576255.1 ribonuclease P protein component [Peptoniphilus asaccharolyticus]SMB87996.1 ribonuclease P protein component [Peptoniphilus asaccharolyticus DSM 20463]